MSVMRDVSGPFGVDATGLDESRRHQPGTPIYCTNCDEERVQHALAEAGHGQPGP